MKRNLSNYVNSIFILFSIAFFSDLEHSNATDLGDGDPGKNWTDSDANFPQQGNKFGQDQHFQLAGIKVGC